ncbi:ABC transporter ATP-binding protein [Actinokineospora globicatena]|uniref:ABC transporter ATP-binding protein n=1 Tax=Actinokineospora globicatena TaxID=103729 RepID=UPI0020A5FC37|nr:ABC transporter ATP-binding protein [Actinokineospora globicatena]MCP2300538.1 ABC-2 type transport system ATP-binding protein [Actinokineospora globicatena]GLW81081.1 daunorubicin resistance protein DrrA family ABC transporter ATP-binding protein [Actinokineospora globicatena]GLW88274.1 daunorubicin resistance protein DrrA family ABC transporter ATP-binding protein [Actinokineospora globicatena]
MRAVEVSDLVKLYKKNPKPAVDGLSFGVEAGEVFGLLGPNGAGKTTTVGVLTTRVLPTSGQVSVHGVDVVRDARRARQLLAVVPQRNNLDRSLNIRQNLLFHAAYHGVPRAERTARADEILERMGLADRAKDRIDIVSGGQAQRVMIARALMHQPKVMFLDEPSTGLDPQARLFVHDRVKDLRAEGVTVVLTTHDMDEAAKLCDRVGIVDHGKLLALDTPAALTRGLPGSTTVSVTVNLVSTPAELVEKALTGIEGVERVERIAAGGPAVPSALPPGLPPGALAAIAAKAQAQGPAATPTTGQFRLYTGQEAAVVLPAVLRVLGDTACEVTDLSIGTPSLEDVFIHLTGRELR